jgi:hypothetical protein
MLGAFIALSATVWSYMYREGKEPFTPCIGVGCVIFAGFGIEGLVHALIAYYR